MKCINRIDQTTPVNVETILCQIWYVSIGVLAIVRVNINSDTGHTISSFNDTFRNLKAMNHLISIQIINPDGWSLHLRSIIYSE